MHSSHGSPRVCKAPRKRIAGRCYVMREEKFRLFAYCHFRPGKSLCITPAKKWACDRTLYILKL
jgi:hypothetical protein